MKKNIIKKSTESQTSTTNNNTTTPDSTQDTGFHNFGSLSSRREALAQRQLNNFRGEPYVLGEEPRSSLDSVHQTIQQAQDATLDLPLNEILSRGNQTQELVVNTPLVTDPIIDAEQHRGFMGHLSRYLTSTTNEQLNDRVTGIEGSALTPEQRDASADTLITLLDNTRNLQNNNTQNMASSEQFRVFLFQSLNQAQFTNYRFINISANRDLLANSRLGAGFTLLLSLYPSDFINSFISLLAHGGYSLLPLIIISVFRPYFLGVHPILTLSLRDITIVFTTALSNTVTGYRLHTPSVSFSESFNVRLSRLVEERVLAVETTRITSINRLNDMNTRATERLNQNGWIRYFISARTLGITLSGLSTLAWFTFQNPRVLSFFVLQARPLIDRGLAEINQHLGPVSLHVGVDLPITDIILELLLNSNGSFELFLISLLNNT